MNVLLFDIDGTLLRTHGAGLRSTNKVFEDLYGIKDAWGEIQAGGKTDPLIVNEVARNVLGRELTAEEMSVVLQRYINYFEEEILEAKFVILPGVVELLENLVKNSKYFLGLQTGNIKAGADIKLKRGKLDHYFKFGGFACDSADRKQLVAAAVERANKLSPGYRRIIAIGDTPHDITAARHNGVEIVSVCTGPFSKAELAEHKPDLLIDNLTNQKELFEFLEG